VSIVNSPLILVIVLPPCGSATGDGRGLPERPGCRAVGQPEHPRPGGSTSPADAHAPGGEDVG